MLTPVSDPCESASSPFEDRYADVCTFRTRFWRAGNAGPAVILLAGIGCSVLEWEKNIAALADRHRVYAFDMLGHGLTDKPRKNCYAIADLARFTLAFLSAQGEDSAHFIGSSLGGPHNPRMRASRSGARKIHGPCRPCRNRARDCAHHAPCECAGPRRTPDAPEPDRNADALGARVSRPVICHERPCRKQIRARPRAHQAVLKTLPVVLRRRLFHDRAGKASNGERRIERGFLSAGVTRRSENFRPVSGGPGAAADYLCAENHSRLSRSNSAMSAAVRFLPMLSR
jgi:hypothetical protein